MGPGRQAWAAWRVPTCAIKAERLSRSETVTRVALELPRGPTPCTGRGLRLGRGLDQAGQGPQREPVWEPGARGQSAGKVQAGCPSLSVRWAAGALPSEPRRKKGRKHAVVTTNTVPAQAQSSEAQPSAASPGSGRGWWEGEVAPLGPLRSLLPSQLVSHRPFSLQQSSCRLNRLNRLNHGALDSFTTRHGELTVAHKSAV